MKSNFLFPYQFKRMGWILLVLSLIIGVTMTISPTMFDFLKVPVLSIINRPIMGDTVFFSFIENNIKDEITGILFIIGALFIAFSREKTEDEYISKIRLESLVWATYINYLNLILSLIFIYEMAFFMVLVYNMFTVLVFFIIRFNWILNRTKKTI